ncbi:hypothetical protein QAD02_011820 [Eretmocerus hayati]|uniref:Uncharacterized protein n=1 Tax=Eretmocerus hayati TaxID=131215 RepID=A0ACC2NY81_9HYME|nr:hypothetical protein QAD02_011820 [Eretmocerus hayati]
MDQIPALLILLLVRTSSQYNEGQVNQLIIYDVGETVNDECHSEIYCEGELLKTVQLLEVFKDCKDFVDMPMKHSSKDIIKRFEELMKAAQVDSSALHLLDQSERDPLRNKIINFVSENFKDGKGLLEPVDLIDWKKYPKFIPRIRDRKYQEWASDLNKIWNDLARKMIDDVRDHPERHSLIYVDNPFVIPGGRFREFYYWDTYWVIEGLLLCDMHDTVRGMIENLLSMVKAYGFIPNGGRIYYLSRSQPPLLIPMVSKYFDFTQDESFVFQNLDTLEMELDYWMRHKSVKIGKNGRNYTLSRYVTNSTGPRPESYREDHKLASELTDPGRKFKFYNDIKAGAESGWDFSSRWFTDKNNARSLQLDDIIATKILPVDLNSFIQWNAKILSKFFARKKNFEKARFYKKIADDYQNAIEALLWNEKDGTWYDLDMEHGTQRNRFYLSNLTPLYTKSFDERQSEYYGNRSVEYLESNGIQKYKSGIPTSLTSSGQQWDFPNIWAPLQSILVEGLKETHSARAKKFAAEIAHQFLKATYLGYSRHQKMYEKYNATNPGETGQGGEYEPQSGFGWTNGVVLKFIDLYFTGRNKKTKSQ